MLFSLMHAGPYGIDVPASAGPHSLDQRFDTLVASSARLERLWTGGEWCEGPVYVPDGDYVLWSDIPGNRVLRWSERDGSVVQDQPSHFANGHTLDLDGNVIRCEHGRRAVSRLAEQRSPVVIVDRFEGRRLNSPNDVIVKSDGTIWFTDPPYGILSDREGHKADSELDANYVFRFDPADQALTVVTDEVEEPNGLAFSPDESILYVSDTSASMGRQDGNHHIVAFDVVGGRELAKPRIFAVIEPGLADGFRVDRAGNVFSSSADGIHVLAPEGELLGRIPVPEVVSNCAFGGVERTRLFITATSSLYAIELTTVGASPSDLP
jgi:gluconolactonase